MGEIANEERALPEWFIVKREILLSYYQAAECLSKYIRNRERNMEDMTALIEFKRFVCELYLKVRTKIKGNKANKKYRQLDTYLHSGANQKIPLDMWVEWYYNLQDVVERLGITKIERKTLPPERAILEGAI